MPEFAFREMFELAHAETPWRKLTADHVAAARFDGRALLRVEPEALTRLAADAIRDISHLLRPGHLAQMRAILDAAGWAPTHVFTAQEQPMRLWLCEPRGV